MTDSELFDGVADTIRQALVAPDATITPDSTAADVDGWDSLSHTVIMIILERKYGITISDDDSNAPETVGELCGLIRRKLEA